MIEDAGAVVIFSDRDNYTAVTAPQTIKRLKPITNANADLFISLHFESYNYDNNRTEVFF
ncbi:MAG: N-acetylmuramoyl-L-alanine amidase [Bacteroidales bacterium]|nr:N-acetylmuramoyl-L-alanine amidase [Bacteroidales bacterium]